MKTISGYKLLRCLHKGVTSHIYQAMRLSDECLVIIKLSSKKNLSEEKLMHLKREFKLGSQINSPYVISYLELKQDVNYGIALVIEDINAVALTSVIPSQGFSEREFLEIAIQIVQGLQAIHAANIIHKDIKPNNILIQPATKAIKIIDFNNATSLRQEISLGVPRLLGTLKYISPEQTGRINRNVDYRTDFYSLGVMFYQMLCGQLPFIANDALGLIHQHLAKQPQFPHRCKPTVALPISQIVMKLLEKEAENRYQSCEGILHDLAYCLSTLNETGIIPAFKLGLKDFSNKLTLSQHLYGRENEIKLLKNAFERVSKARREIVMVAGQPGVGKSRLIHEIQQSIALKHGFFLTGKFDQLNRNVAYSALRQAFDDFIKCLLVENEANIAQLKTQLLTVLGTQAQLIIKIIPNLALLIGEQPAALIADISQAKTLFNLTFQAFVEVFATATHPLVIFLDDLQWADQASLDLMTYLMQQSKLSHLLWIGAYRDTEVTNLHPAMQAVAALQEVEVCTQTLTLTPLRLGSLQQWLADSLHIPLMEVSSLAELIQQKTAGNPFFVKMFLQSLYDQGLLIFSQQHHWLWDINKIRQHPATENVIALMIYQIRQLSIDTQEALSIASCLGHRIPLGTLQIAMASSKEIVCNAIQSALNSGILIQTNDEVYFAHDRVLEAAYYLLNETEKIQEHFTVGKRLEAHLATEEAWLFDVVSQFNHCRSMVTDLKIVRLNLKASQKAKEATAYAAALNYLRTGEKAALDYLRTRQEEWVETKTLWQVDYPLAFTLYKELAEMEYLCGHIDISQDLITKMQPHLQSILDQVDIYYLLIVQETVQGHCEKAITFGHQALQLLGSGLPLDNPTAFNQREMPLLKQKLADISFSSLLNAPLVENIEKQGMFKILAALISACYQLDPELLFVITLITINQSLIYGNAPEACLSYATYGLLLCSKFQEYALGYEFGNYALQLAEKLQSPVQGSRSAMVMYGFIYAWSKPIQHLPALLTANFEACLACGEIEYAGYCAEMKVLELFEQGAPLAKVQQAALPVLQFAYSTKNQTMKNAIRAMQMLLANLRGDTLDEWSFDTAGIDAIKFEKECQDSRTFFALCNYYIFKVRAFYLYGHFEQALDQLALAKKYLVFIVAQDTTAIFNWYDSLTRLALYESASDQEQQAYLQQVAQNQQQMEKWQASCPENFAHKYLLVAAELTRVKKDYFQAESLYKQATKLAGQHGFIHEQALVAELAAKYWLTRDDPQCAQGYLNLAFSGYKQWGAKRKLTLFKAAYADLLKALAPPGLSKLVVNQETTFGSNILRVLDLSSILKVSHTLSSEIELPKLLRNIMQIIIENAGAQQGALLFIEPDETIFVQAEYTSDGALTTLQKIPLANWTNGSHAVIYYVKTLQQPLVVDNASTHEKFKSDLYISSTQAKSILCIPVLKQTELKALLYLENKLMSHAFTPERVQTIQILTAQMAISLENARYFVEQLELTRQLAEQAMRIKITEESLHVVTHDLQLSLQASKAGTWNYWVDSNKVTWDAGNYVLFGLKPEEFAGTYEAVMACVHSEDRELVHQNVRRCIEQDIPLEIEFRVIWRDGSQHVVSAHGRVYRDISGRPIKMAGVNRDVTLSRQLEQERRALQQAEAEQRERAHEAIAHKVKLEEITDTLCHELRNPLNGLYGSINLLHEAIKELKLVRDWQTVTAINDFLIEAEEQLDIVDICIKQLKEIVDDVLDYSKLEDNKIVLVEIPFDLVMLIKSVVQMFLQSIKQKNIDIILELPDQAIVLKSDESQLKRVIINLLNNAIKFTFKGNIKIKVEEKALSLTETELCFTIEDTGIGIPAAEQVHLFERFSSASRRTSAKYGGSGLGLAISKKLVEKMGGKIWVESEQGKGSKFTFTIKCKPLTAEERAELEQEKTRESLIFEPMHIEKSSTNKNILIVEDNIVNQKLLVSYLQKAGYLYQVANNGLEAIQRFKETKFDTILMDIEMPEMDGIEATKSIRELERGLNYITPIIGLSGYIDEAHKSKALQAGMNDYLVKPYDKEKIYAVLKKYISFTEEVISIAQAEAPIVPAGIKNRKVSKYHRKREKFNDAAANKIISNAIKTSLSYWHAYACAFIPESNQQCAVNIIRSVFEDRKIRDHEYAMLEKVISEAIGCQSPWYTCFSRIYTIDTNKAEFIAKIIAIHDQENIPIPRLQA